MPESLLSGLSTCRRDLPTAPSEQRGFQRKSSVRLQPNKQMKRKLISLAAVITVVADAAVADAASVVYIAAAEKKVYLGSSVLTDICWAASRVWMVSIRQLSTSGTCKYTWRVYQMQLLLPGASRRSESAASGLPMTP